VSLPPGAREVRPLGGGDINEAFHVVLADGREAFVKTRADAAHGEYAAEAAGLCWLGEADALRVPAVLGVEDGYLALEWVAAGRLDADGEQELGRGLALTHGAGAPRFGRFAGTGHGGGPRGDERVVAVELGDDTGAYLDDAWLGSLRVSNAPSEDWPTFYAERRLRPLAALAFDRGMLGHAGIQAVERICEQIADLAGPPEPPARLHGDLWLGNVLADADGRPWLIDPSAFGGHREVDLAMLALFGGPLGAMLDGYQELAPLADGWEERVGLYQLLPLLVHAILFGGSYGQAVERIARRHCG
jgi:fructosamine-3-kinase